MVASCVTKARSMASNKTLYDAAVVGNVAVARQLIDSGSALDQVGVRVFAASFAVWFPTNARARMSQVNGNTPMVAAAYYGHTEMVKLLLTSGANIASTNVRPVFSR